MKCPRCHADNPETQLFCGACGTRIQGQDPGRPAVTETIETAREELTTGSTFAGRYQVIEELGHGGMGRVYKVLDTKIGEKIALKLIRPEAGLNKEALERFSNELKLARKIRHKNVCQMFDLGEDRGTRYITMEYVHGEDLRQLLRKVGRLSPAQAVAVARQVCAGLEEAHRLGVVHRDLKPQNIMLDEDGHARIMDFGIARSLAGKSITGAGTFIGTPEYMSPEQVESKEVDQRSDIYSLGVILYEMVAGRRPFDGETALAIAHKHRYEAPEDPRTADPQIPEHLAQVILRCLEKDKAARYESAGALDTDLGTIEEGLPTTERIAAKRKPFTSKEITVKFNLRKALVPAILVLAVITAVVFFLIIRKPSTVLNPKLVLVNAFINRTGDASLEVLGSITADEITHALSRTGIVEVVPTMVVLETSRIFKAEGGKGPAGPRAWARETGAGIIVSGTYDLIDGELQFRASVTDVTPRKPKLIQSLGLFEGSVDNKMELVEELRGRIIGILALYLTDARSIDYVSRLRRPPTYEAYQEYLQGLDTFGVEYGEAVRHFERAVELDPAFTQAKLWIAVAYGNQGRYEEADACLLSIISVRGELSPIENRLLDWYMAELHGQREKALRHILDVEKLAPNQYTIKYIVGLNALEINQPRKTIETYAWMDSRDQKIFFRRPVTAWWLDVLAEAHHLLSEFRKELKVARRGKRFFPKNLGFSAVEARALAARGKIGEVRRVIEGCQTANAPGDTPGSVMMEAALELNAHGYKDASREFAERAIAWAEGRPDAERKTGASRRFYANALYFAGRWDEAGSIFGSLAAEDPEDIGFQGILGALAARRGARDEALRIFGELAKIDQRFIFGEHFYWRARIASLLGEKEQAVSLLKEAFGQGWEYDVTLHRDIDFEPIWDYPPFKELLRPKG